VVIDVHIRDRCYFLLLVTIEYIWPWVHYFQYVCIHTVYNTHARAHMHTHARTYTHTHTHTVEHLFITNLHKIWLAWDLWKSIQYVNSGVSECTRRGCDHCSLLFIFSFKILPQRMKLKCIFISTTVNIQYCFASICVHNISRRNTCQINQLS
jgi:hypothetical protein